MFSQSTLVSDTQVPPPVAERIESETKALDTFNPPLRFYWTVASGSSRKALQQAAETTPTEDHGQIVERGKYPEPQYAMVSYETQNNTPWQGPEWFIDSGGFSALTNSETGTFESTVEEYIAYVRSHLDRGINIGRWALRDWPCDPDILDTYGRTVRDHQRWTVRDHVECLEVADEYGVADEAEPVTVLQGEVATDYLWHLDYCRDHGLLSDHIGIGSLCGRPPQELSSIIESVVDAVPSRYSVHGFGVKNKTLTRAEAVRDLDSVDTAAWNYSAMVAATQNDDVRYTWIENLKAFQDYRRRLQEIFSTTGSADSTLKGLHTFLDDRTSATGESQDTILQCRCGTLVDPNAIRDGDFEKALTGSGCRSCRVSVINHFDRIQAEQQTV